MKNHQGFKKVGKTGFEPPAIGGATYKCFFNKIALMKNHQGFKKVGKTGFEPATPCTPYKCATGLRHFPNKRGANLN